MRISDWSSDVCSSDLSRSSESPIPNPQSRNFRMKFSENWLRQHVTTDATRHALAATLTAFGLEVGELMPLGEEIDGVVVARFESAENHPDAERLPICKIVAGNGTKLQILCSAPNARAGRVAPLATIATRIGA